MERPSWWLPRPGGQPDVRTRRAFDALYAEALAAGPSTPIDYRLDAPKWQFLCHLGDAGLVVMHGSGRDDIAEFQPRQSNDVSAFGAQRAVYASSDGIWPLFFAVIDRDGYDGTLVNASIRLGDEREPAYFFSLNAEQLPSRPWRDGTVYLLPPRGFLDQPGIDTGPERVASTQVASLEPVAPLARLRVSPTDFPFLDRVRGHDEAVLRRRSTADPDGFPWLQDSEASH